MTMIYNRTGFTLNCMFYDENKTLVVPESLTYTISNDITGEVLESQIVVPTLPSYTIPLSVELNTILGTSERRKVVIEWIYNDGKSGDTERYYYTIEKA